jgi:hypothetical protein
MNDSISAAEDDLVPEGLARRLFVMTMIGIAVCVGVILTLMSTVD